MNRTCLVTGVYLHRLDVRLGWYVVLGKLVIRVIDYNIEHDLYTVEHIAGPRYVLLEGSDDELPGEGI